MVNHSTANPGLIQAIKENMKDTLADGASGAIAGFLSTLILHPLENIRTRLQDYESAKEADDEEKQVS